MSNMVQKQGVGIFFSHTLILFGIAIILFPIYLAFVASTHEQAALVTPPMPLVPGDFFWSNYSEALGSGVNVPVWKMLMNSMVMSLGITIGKIVS